MEKPLVSIIVVGYNSGKFLESCFASLQRQVYHNREIIFIDNASEDASCEFIEHHFQDILIVANNQNIGLDRAWNQGISLAKGKYVMLLNPDIIFENDYLEKCVKKMEEDKKIGVISGKIYKYDFEKRQKTNLIDTVGLFCYRNRRIIDDGQGLEDNGQFEREKEVFGVSGACPLFRKEALEDVKIDGEYIDGDFFMYKEDIDICWRLRLFGWNCFYYPSAVAHHGRGTGVLKRFSHWEVAKNRGKLSKFQKYLSYRNQRWMQVKNEFFVSILKDLFPILWKEILAFGYIVVREPSLLKAFGETILGLPKMLKKRRYIFNHKRVSRREMEQWLRGKQSTYLMPEQAGHENT
jgi:GT2 family glycosyltransferase